MSLALAGQEVLVIGLGMSGLSAARFCAERGAEVTAWDQRPADAIAGIDALPASVRVVTAGPMPDPAAFDLVVPSPGVPPERYAGRAHRIHGDVELAFRALSIPIVAVTGTNGKSTTVRLIEAMLCAGGRRARAAGNVGTPALSLVGEPLDVAVLEVSSFQLETVDAFRPAVAVVLNVTPDHLDRHGDLLSYAAAKQRILARQQPEDAAVLNFDDPVVRAMADTARARVIAVSRLGPVERGIFHDGGTAVWRDAGRSVRLDLSGLPISGVHNLENVLAALASVLVLDVDPSAALHGLKGFRALRHRCEVVARSGGVTWVDDSKATNPGAAIRSLESFDAPIVWIAGGRDKSLDFGPLADAAAPRVARALLIGESAPKLARVLSGRVPLEVAGDLSTAVARAAEIAGSGDVVLLAPACASFDQFANYEARGEAFRAEVQRRVGGGTS